MNNMTELVVKNAMRDMFSRGRVDICSIKECLKLMNMTPVGDDFNYLSALHCVSFKDMDKELAEQIPGMVERVFNGITLDFEPPRIVPTVPTQMRDITPEPAPRKAGLLSFLGGKQ